jgi:hypothetical protein
VLDKETIEHIARIAELEGLHRQTEADHARNGTGPFADMPKLSGDHPATALTVIATVNDVVANAFAEFARDLRNL